MLKAFTVKNFRGLRDVRLKDLGRINLISGQNNSGKTSLLEALLLFGGGTNAPLALQVDAMRGIESVRIEMGPNFVPPWQNIFSDGNLAHRITLEGRDSAGRTKGIQVDHVTDERELRSLGSRPVTSALPQTPSTTTSPLAMLRMKRSNGRGKGRIGYLMVDESGMRQSPALVKPTHPGRFMSPREYSTSGETADRFGSMVLQGLQDEVIAAIQIIEPRIAGIVAIPHGNKSILHALVGSKRPTPLALEGAGLVRLCNIIINIIASKDGILMIDEVENGIHHSRIADLWRVVAKTAERHNCQVFATTHSYECIAAAFEALSGEADKALKLFRLDRTEKGVSAVAYSPKLFKSAQKFELEVR
jgi:energy-coupling factor transporter ATP-binding protein EcfA2